VHFRAEPVSLEKFVRNAESLIRSFIMPISIICTMNAQRRSGAVGASTLCSWADGLVLKLETMSSSSLTADFSGCCYRRELFR
jgi:hypothetical protein